MLDAHVLGCAVDWGKGLAYMTTPFQADSVECLQSGES